LRLDESVMSDAERTDEPSGDEPTFRELAREIIAEDREILDRLD